MLKLLALITLGVKLFEPGPWRDARKSLHFGSRVQTFFSPQAPGHWKWKLPSALVAFRVMLGPLLLLICLQPRSSLLLASGVVLALISDIFDGVLARRWHVDSARLRVADTVADTLFYCCILAVILLRFPGFLQRHWLLLVMLVAAEAGQQAFAFLKFGRNASYHSLLSKFWGLLLATATIALLGFGVDNWLLDAAIAWGIVCNLEGLAMSLMLPMWRPDVLTLGHALRLRRTLQSQGEFLGV
ncbi:MAG TPA: CDP-alcohol phosphatidyltransferase family protein [Candidatus Angelobacter sp.]|nr:CDP-alcohol phosphatidyltransferase family protein [Candidatus Angelobacter sp.]